MAEKWPKKRRDEALISFWTTPRICTKHGRKMALNSQRNETKKRFKTKSELGPTCGVPSTTTTNVEIPQRQSQAR
jgi:hypothetical protein